MPSKIDYRAEFKEKENILAQYGEWISPYEFFDLVFQGSDMKMMLVRGGDKFFAMERSEGIEYCLGRDDVYVCMAGFYDDCKKDDFIDELYAFVIDIDNVRPSILERIVSRVLSDGRDAPPRPTLISNTGYGIHLYYVLDGPLKTYPTERKKARELYKALNDAFAYNVDRHSIGQAFRPAGGMTKLGDIATAYRLGDVWPIRELANEIGYMWDQVRYADTGLPATSRMIQYAGDLADRYEVPEPDYSNFQDTYDFIKAHAAKRKKLHSSFYDWTRMAVLERTEINHRYKSMVALAVIAYKCGVPKEQLEKDLRYIAAEWRKRPGWENEPFKEARNIPAALRCYNEKALTTRPATLEEWLGWSFPRRPKQKPTRNIHDHLEYVAGIKEARCLDKIAAVLMDDPAASKTKVAKAAGVSRTTVYKYYDEARSRAERKKRRK